jgi:hypothetical protein
VISAVLIRSDEFYVSTEREMSRDNMLVKTIIVYQLQLYQSSERVCVCVYVQ